MENMFVWTLVFAGATISLLATFLIASEREVKIKRREIEELKVKVRDSHSDELHGIQATDTQAAELTAQNEDLLATNMVEENEKTKAELRILQHRLGDYESENGELQLTNQRLQADIADLNNQLQANATRFNESADQTQEVTKCKSHLEAQIAELQHKLSDGKVHLEELENARQRLADAESRETALRERQHILEQEIEELRQEVSAQQQNVGAIETIRTYLQETERLHQEARSENRRLQEEIARWQERLAAREESKRQFAIFRQHFGELQAKQASIAETQRQFHSEMIALVRTLDGSYSDFTNSSPEISNETIEFHASVDTNDAVSHRVQAIGLARDQINQRRYYDALANLNGLLKADPNNREARLHHLLAEIHLHGIESYEDRIDSIKDMAELSESERITARDIFLLRADAAQKSGQDNEMLRYRAWARNVIYRAPFTNMDNEAAAPALGAAESNGQRK
jgi:hypothetical protein